MDRREALQKMMAGGAVVVGASMVSSSPVFAAQSAASGTPVGPGLTTAPPNAQIINDKRNATWTVSAPNVVCTSGTLRMASYAVPLTLSGSVTVMINSPSGYGDPYILGGDTLSFTAVGTGPGNSPFRQGDSFQVTWSVRYECIEGGQVAGCQIVDYTYRYLNQANGNPSWQPYLGYPMTSQPRSCL